MIGDSAEAIGGVLADRREAVGMQGNVGTLGLDAGRDIGHDGLESTLFAAQCCRNSPETCSFAPAGADDEQVKQRDEDQRRYGTLYQPDCTRQRHAAECNLICKAEGSQPAQGCRNRQRRGDLRQSVGR